MSTTVVPSAITPSTYVSARFGPGKVSFPVSGANGYAQFEHVRGVPAREPSTGVSVNRLFILNSLIGRYARLAGRQSGTINAGESDASDSRIVEEAQRLNEIISHSPYGGSYGNGIYETGHIFSIVK